MFVYIVFICIPQPFQKALPGKNLFGIFAEQVQHLILHRGMLMYGKEASNRKQEIDRQHHTIPSQRNQRPKDKHCGNVYNLLFRHGKVRSQNMEKLKCSFPTFCKQTFPQLHKTASYAHYAQCRLLRNPSFSISFKSYLFVLWNIGQPPFCHSIKDRQ